MSTHSIKESISRVEALLKAEANLSPAFQAAIEMLLLVVKFLFERVSKNSKNSSLAPSQDPNRLKPTRVRSGKKPGGQLGHKGYVLQPVTNPDEVVELMVNPTLFEAGHSYRKVDEEKRQVIDLILKRHVVEYRAEVWADEAGNQVVAPFPEHVKADVQYSTHVKAHVVYLSTFQLLPTARIQDYLANEVGIAISEASVCNWVRETAVLPAMERFEHIAKSMLTQAKRLHADETSININGKKQWLHNASDQLWTWLELHAKRGALAMRAIGILPAFLGVLCHDHWQAYYAFTLCLHALCNAHHLRELQSVIEVDKQHWAQEMKDLLIVMNEAVRAAKGPLSQEQAQAFARQYKDILRRGESECPRQQKAKGDKKRGRVKQTKARNLWQRLMDREADVLRFTTDVRAAFTNNQGELDLRMSKVQQKVSGCFRSLESAQAFFKIRSYLSTCRKHGVSATEALDLLFRNQLPDFCQSLSLPL